jgi:hypothetical protein
MPVEYREDPRRTRVSKGDARSEQMRLSLIFGAAKKLATRQEPVSILSPRSSGRSDGSTTASPAVNTNGADPKLADT